MVFCQRALMFSYAISDLTVAFVLMDRRSSYGQKIRLWIEDQFFDRRLADG